VARVSKPFRDRERGSDLIRSLRILAAFGDGVPVMATACAETAARDEAEIVFNDYVTRRWRKRLEEYA